MVDMNISLILAIVFVVLFVVVIIVITLYYTYNRYLKKPTSTKLKQDVEGLSSVSSKSRYTASIRGNLVRTFNYPVERDYNILTDRELGKGGVGVVYIGEKKENRQLYAIKYVNKIAYEREAVRLERELKLLKDVDHANIVRVFCVYNEPHKTFFVMELCSGGHLGNLLYRQKDGRLDEDWARRLCRQLVSAVAHIHSKGICHRDIKLQNILLDNANDSTAQVKLIDFGYGAKFRGNLPMRTKCGTPYTTAPEVFRECYDERCDVWSIGVVLYIMLSGRRPFETLEVAGGLREAGRAAMIANILACRYHMDHPTFNKVSQQAKIFVQRLLHPQYEKRITSQQALEYPWLSDNVDDYQYDNALMNMVSSSSKGSRAILNMKNTALNNTRNLTMIPLVFSLPLTQTTEIRKLFQSFDRDSSGCLSRPEYVKAMSILSPDLSLEDMNHLFDIIDIDSDGSISYTEFLAATLDPRGIDLTILNEAFNLLDADGKGYINYDDIRRMLKVDYDEILELQKEREREAATIAAAEAARTALEQRPHSLKRMFSLSSGQSLSLRAAEKKSLPPTHSRAPSKSEREHDILRVVSKSVLRGIDSSTGRAADNLLLSPSKAAAQAAAALGFPISYRGSDNSHENNVRPFSKPASRRFSKAATFSDETLANEILAFNNENIEEFPSLHPQEIMEQRIRDMINLYDVDKDGVISLDEFLWALTDAGNLFGTELPKKFITSKRLSSSAKNSSKLAAWQVSSSNMQSSAWTIKKPIIGSSAVTTQSSSQPTANQIPNKISEISSQVTNVDNMELGASASQFNSNTASQVKTLDGHDSHDACSDNVVIENDTKVENFPETVGDIESGDVRAAKKLSLAKLVGDVADFGHESNRETLSIKRGMNHTRSPVSSPVNRPDEFNFSTASLPVYKRSPLQTPTISPHSRINDQNSVNSSTTTVHMLNSSGIIKSQTRGSKVLPLTNSGSEVNDHGSGSSILRNISGIFGGSISHNSSRVNSSKRPSGHISGSSSAGTSLKRYSVLSYHKPDPPKEQPSKSSITQEMEDVSEISPKHPKAVSDQSKIINTLQSNQSTTFTNSELKSTDGRRKSECKVDCSNDNEQMDYELDKLMQSSTTTFSSSYANGTPSGFHVTANSSRRNSNYSSMSSHNREDANNTPKIGSHFLVSPPHSNVQAQTNASAISRTTGIHIIHE